MWTSNGTKLSGDYGTWQGREYELRSTEPIRGLIYLVQEGGTRPGTDWEIHDQPHTFPRPPVAYTLGVPPEEVTDIHAFLATGELRPGREVEIVGEDAEGNLAVVAGTGFSAEAKMDLIEEQGFYPFSDDEPVGRQPVFGWLPAEMVHNIKTVVRWRKDAH